MFFLHRAKVEQETDELRDSTREPDEQNRSEKQNEDIGQPQHAGPGAGPRAEVEAAADTPCTCEAELKVVRAEHTALKKRTDRTEAKVADLYAGLRAKEANAALFGQAIGGRRQAQANSCTGQLMVANRVAEVNEACCGGGGVDGHRRTQDESGGSTCTRLPKQCTVTCAPVFIAFREDCEEMLEEAGMDMQQVERLHESCLQQISVDQGSCGAQIGRRILQRADSAADSTVNTGATAAMIIPLTIVTDAQTGMLLVLGQNGRRRSQEAGAETVQEFRCECGSGSISSCIPICGEIVHGYELLLTIDETDIRVSW